MLHGLAETSLRSALLGALVQKPVFPLPLTSLDPVVARSCVDAFALEDKRLDGEGVLPHRVEQFVLANGIIIAATLGERTIAALATAGRQHLDMVRSWAIPLPRPMRNETVTEPRSPERYRLRAEELRVIAEQLTSPDHKNALVAISADYERFAQSAERITQSRRLIDET